MVVCSFGVTFGSFEEQIINIPVAHPVRGVGVPERSCKGIVRTSGCSFLCVFHGVFRNIKNTIRTKLLPPRVAAASLPPSKACETLQPKNNDCQKLPSQRRREKQSEYLRCVSVLQQTTLLGGTPSCYPRFVSSRSQVTLLEIAQVTLFRSPPSCPPLRFDFWFVSAVVRCVWNAPCGVLQQRAEIRASVICMYDLIRLVAMSKRWLDKTLSTLCANFYP